MEYQKMTNLLDNTPNQPTKFRTKNWVELNDESGGKYKTSTLRSKNFHVKVKFMWLYWCIWKKYNN